jgi:CheY-like chemotaxis protein
MVKILIAEDVELLRQRVAKMLGEAGYQTLEAENGNSAIDAYKASSLDLVDGHHYARDDGLAALRAILDLTRGQAVMLCLWPGKCCSEG